MGYNSGIMSTARQPNLISVDDYLTGEQPSEVRHEYVAGVVDTMVDATNAHSIIAANVQGTLRDQLKNSPCREFNSDTKVRIRSNQGIRFYYPDVQVVCQQNPQSDVFQASPVLIAEVRSDSTRQTDEGEKKNAYLSIPSLQMYVMIDQSAKQAVVYKWIDTGFECQFLAGEDCEIVTDALALSLPIAEIYRDIKFEQAT